VVCALAECELTLVQAHASASRTGKCQVGRIVREAALAGDDVFGLEMEDGGMVGLKAVFAAVLDSRVALSIQAGLAWAGRASA
jgi:hypothetical protein